MKNRRFTYIYILLAALLLGASYQLNYRDSKEAMQHRINEQFREAVPHWGNAICDIQKIPYSRRYDSESYARKTKTTIIYEKELSKVWDTIVISARYYLPKERYEYQKRNLECSLILCDDYKPALADSLFNNLLSSLGIEAEVATELHVKELKEMFPTVDSMNVNAPIREVLAAKHVEGFTTDTVGIGICDQGLMVGKVALERSTIRSGMRWIAWRQVLLLLFMAVLYIVILYLRKAMAYRQGVHLIGNTCIDFNTATLHHWNGDTVTLTATREALLRMLIEAAPEYMLTKEDICRTIWQRDVKDGQALYNVAVSELRSYLIAPDDALTLTTLPKVGIQFTVDHTKLRPLRKLHCLMRVVKG